MELDRIIFSFFFCFFLFFSLFNFFSIFLADKFFSAFQAPVFFEPLLHLYLLVFFFKMSYNFLILFYKFCLNYFHKVQFWMLFFGTHAFLMQTFYIIILVNSYFWYNFMVFHWFIIIAIVFSRKHVKISKEIDVMFN